MRAEVTVILPSKTPHGGFVYGELALKAEVSFSTSHCSQRVPHFISLRVKRTVHTAMMTTASPEQSART